MIDRDNRYEKMSQTYRTQRRGFTLIELMITVAILAVLASLATVAYARYQKRARLAAVESFFAEIATDQETYRDAEGNNQYWDSGSDQNDWYPSDVNEGPTDWNPSSSYAWDTRGISPGRQTFFQYVVFSGVPADSTCNAPTPDDSSLSPNESDVCDSLTMGTHWWYAVARGDQDGDDTLSVFFTTSEMYPNLVRSNDLE